MSDIWHHLPAHTSRLVYITFYFVSFGKLYLSAWDGAHLCLLSQPFDFVDDLVEPDVEENAIQDGEKDQPKQIPDDNLRNKLSADVFLPVVVLSALQRHKY